MAEISTVFLAVLAIIFSLVFATGDGGNIDFYWKPLLAVWFFTIAGSFLFKGKSSYWVFIRKSWWLQILLPVVLFFVSVFLVSIYKPYALGISGREKIQTQSPVIGSDGAKLAQ